MLQFQELTSQHGAQLRRYYETCDYRLCEYSLGVKLMWRGYLHPSFAEAAGCLIIRNCIEGEYVFDYPITGTDGDTEGALRAIESWCSQKGLPLVLSVVPEDKAGQLVLRYPRCRVISERPWKDYLYRTEELAAFAGRRYSGQRNHINKFRRDFPDAEFTPLTDPQDPRLAAFWRDYEAEFHKTGPLAVQELALAQEMFSRIGTGWFCAGGMMAEGRLVAVCLAEKCGGTLVNHIEKALYSHAGAYPALVQAFADHYGGDCQWCNREDDARDKGLRTSKLQYLPEALAGKVRMEVGTELDALSDSELAARCMRVSVYARVSPAHKLRIVRAYKAAGQVVAMTGDGVIGQCHLASRRRAMYRMHASKGYSKAGGRIQSTLRLSARTTVSGMVSPTGIEPAA